MDGSAPNPDAPTLLVFDDDPRPETVLLTPGAVVAGRYRIISLLGRGGMGEVYRAEDLRLSQPVALKYLPQSVAARPGALDRLYAEVRLGRQISHPNVCRLYDIVEVSGHHFIAMEYVDGEDLASLLRRVGKLPAAKVTQIARDVFAALAAVHEHGVVHRDIKPANVMLDARGRARLTDFGLAVISANTGGRREIAGTPAYMSPEQISGERITPQSDIYSLALVLHELFTGRRLYDGSSLTEIAGKHNQPKPRLASGVPDIDPAVERIVMRCLAENPDERPSSARAVLAELPDSDPLAEFVRIGETPSAALVAAAGEEGTVSSRTGALLLAAALIALLAAAYVSTDLWVWTRTTMKSPEVLEDRAAEVVRLAGYDPATLHRIPMWRSTTQALVYVERISAKPLAAMSASRVVVLEDPPPSPDAGLIVLAPDGRLRLFDAPREMPPVRPPSLQKLAEATAMPLVELHTEMERGRLLSIEAPQAREALRRRGTRLRSAVISSALELLAFLLILIAAVRNVRTGRVDRRGASRAAIATAVLGVSGGLLRAHHVADLYQEWAILKDVVGVSLFYAAQIGLGYVAIEPYLRRRMPHAVISWTRAFSGRWRDPMVARDILIGLVTGLTAFAIEAGPFSLLKLEPWPSSLTQISPPEVVAASLVRGPLVALYYTLGLAMLLVVLRMILPHRVAAVVFAAIFFLARWPATVTPVTVACVAAAMLVLTACLVRFGILAFACSLFAASSAARLPLSLDFSVWYSGRVMLTMAVFTAIALYGWRYATRPVPRWTYGASYAALGE